MAHETTNTGPPHRGAISRVALIGSGVFLLFALWLSIPAFFDYMKGPTPRSTCMVHLKRIALAHLQYSQDYDERMPLVNVHDAGISPERPLGWADALQPYLRSTEIFQCPAQTDNDTTHQPNENGYTDYWYNARLADVNHSSLRHYASILLNGEGNDGTDATNARYSLDSLPAAWDSAEHPALRHLDGANYSFMDGHVKWLRPKAVTAKKPDGKNATFLVK